MKNKNRDSKIELLKNIWAHIPNPATEQTVLPAHELAKKFLNLFHPGPFFYFFFNTRTAVMEPASADIETVIGYIPDEFNLQRFVHRIHPDDLPYYIHHEKSATEFFSRLPQDKLTKYKFSHDVRWRHKNEEYKRLLIQILPIFYFPEGGARTLCIFTDITHLKLYGRPSLSFIGLDGEPSFYNVDLSSEFRPVVSLFSKRETEILRYIAEGYSSPEISEQLHISNHTTNTHRKNILAKAGCSSTSDLIARSIRNGWI